MPAAGLAGTWAFVTASLGAVAALLVIVGATVRWRLWSVPLVALCQVGLFWPIRGVLLVGSAVYFGPRASNSCVSHLQQKLELIVTLGCFVVDEALGSVGLPPASIFVVDQVDLEGQVLATEISLPLEVPCLPLDVVVSIQIVVRQRVCGRHLLLPSRCVENTGFSPILLRTRRELQFRVRTERLLKFWFTLLGLRSLFCSSPWLAKLGLPRRVLPCLSERALIILSVAVVLYQEIALLHGNLRAYEVAFAGWAVPAARLADRALDVLAQLHLRARRLGAPQALQVQRGHWLRSATKSAEVRKRLLLGVV